MAVFGRLDVRFPDGHTDSHQLEGERVTVGSAAINSIQLDDSAIAAAHFQIDFNHNSVSLTDLGSDAGTFIAGERLIAHTPRILRAVEQIHLGGLLLTFYQRSDSPTVAMPAYGEQTQPSAIDFRASLERGEYTVFPASSVTVAMAVSNLGQVEALFRVETSGLPEDWVKPESLVFPLPAGESTQLQFHIKPARRSDKAPGDYPLVITITRLGDQEQALQLVAVIKLGGYAGLSLALVPALCREGESFSLYLLNQGNRPLELALAVDDTQAQLFTDLAQDQVELPAGERRRISGGVRARRRALIGKPVETPFAIIAQSRDPSAFTAAAPGRAIVSARWSYRTAMLAAAVAIALLLGAAAVLIQPPEPEISSFGLSHAQVARGTPVGLEWTAANAQAYVIEVDRARVAELPNDAETFTLDTGEYTDPVDIALIARQDGITVIETRRLDVYEPVVVAGFEANKTVMPRRVNGTLVVRWEVAGAVSLNITSPLAFETVRESPAAAAKGELELRGAPDADFAIKLTAEDEIGTIVERSITIAVKEPECLPLYDTILYAGPDKRFPQSGLAVANVPVLVRGRVADGTWLHVELASGRAVWGIGSSFECSAFDVDALTVIEDAPQLPTATASPTPTATATQPPAPTATATLFPDAADS